MADRARERTAFSASLGKMRQQARLPIEAKACLLLCRLSPRKRARAVRAPCLCGARAAPFDATQGAAGQSRRGPADSRYHCAGSRLWPLWLPPDHGSAERGRLGCERSAGGPHLAARGVEGSWQATEAAPALAGRWVLHPATVGAHQPRMGLRLRRGPHLRRQAISHAQHR
jgi:hypothetical protein